MVLLLSSLSIQSAVLQSRSSEFTLRRRRQQEDALASAAQLIAARLAAYPCALLLPSRLWSDVPPAPLQPCTSAVTLQQIGAGVLPGPDAERGQFQLSSYEPLTSSTGVIEAADLTVQWMPARGRVSQRRFRVMLAAIPNAGSDGSVQVRLQGVRP